MLWRQCAIPDGRLATPTPEGTPQPIDKGVAVTRFRLKACAKCGGDLALDEGDWICLQCGTYYYVGLYRHTEAQRRRWPKWPLPREKSAFAGDREAISSSLVVAANLLTALWAGEIITK